MISVYKICSSRSDAAHKFSREFAYISLLQRGLTLNKFANMIPEHGKAKPKQTKHYFRDSFKSAPSVFFDNSVAFNFKPGIK